jgi:hypothetical protein
MHYAMTISTHIQIHILNIDSNIQLNDIQLL